jgi:hypothetical protein
MPKKPTKKPRGVIRYRTIVPKPGRYIHIAVVRKKGPRGGRTVAGPVRHSKQSHHSAFSKAVSSAKRTLSKRR